VRHARVAVTGLGAVTALGADVAALAAALADGRRAIGPLTRFAHAGRCAIAAQVPELTPEAVDGARERLSAATGRRLSYPDRLALAATAQALRQAGLEPDARGDVGVYVGASVGGMADAETAYARRQDGRDARYRLSRLLPAPLSNTAAALAQGLALQGPRMTFSTACSSSALAIAEAADAIARGRVRRAVAVGTDALCRITFSGFDALQALDVRPCRPFAADRAGLSLGEGAAALVLEHIDDARARGAEPLAFVLGHGVATDAHHVTAPHPDGAGARAALEAALASAAVAPEAIDYVNAHGTGTPKNDAIEVAVLRAVLGERLARVPVSSTKAQVGHCLAAAGAVEAVVTVLALAQGLVPPTAGLADVDPAFADLDLVPAPGRRERLGVAVSSSFGFGGHNVTLVFGRA
jgi:3-oxoacyl-[acyl-carrier-protein] synthase II